jgi:hypothetical protein
MSFMKRFKRFGVFLAIISLLGGQMAPIQAAMIGNNELLQQAQQQLDRERLVTLLERADVQQQLVALGVDHEAATARVATLTDNEIAQLNERLGELPAGGTDALAVVLIVFIIFVITDVIGATDIFPFIKPVNK